MFLKKWKRAGAFMMAFTLLLGIAEAPVAKAEEASVNPNLALSAEATASGFENGTSFTADKVNDGNKDSRWATDRAGANWQNEWVQLAWETEQTIQSVSITWKRRTTTNYTIQVSDDGTAWTDLSGYPREEFPVALEETVTLEEAVSGKYLRLYITELDGNDPDGIESVEWKNVSVCEIEVYAQEPENAGGIQKGDTSIDMPDVAEGESVRFCADYEQVIGEDGTIYAPLEEKTVKGFFETTKADGSKEKTQEQTFVVPGAYDPVESANEKPAVIPELQEWHGGTGRFILSASSRIFVSSPELMDMAGIFQKDCEEMTGMKLADPKVGAKEDAVSGDFYFALSSEEKGLGKEGYAMEIGDAVWTEAEDATGAYWATRTILQIVKQTGGSMPKGLVRDYPKYEVRAFSLDVGRKPFTLDAVRQFAENMAWYKMNSFQLHLSDNLIFHEDYPTLEEAIEQSYAGFRLESDVRNDEGKSATSDDVYYTKEEFRDFIKACRNMGVDVVPEFDMPAHALPFTRAFPEFMTAKRGGQHAYLIEEIDLSKPEATEWAKEIWNDYFEGDDPIFDEEMTVHIGTDEFHGVDGQAGKEMFRKFSDDMIRFVQESGRTVRMWGSLSNKSGTTPVASEDVQLNIWNTGYANPQDMYNMGYDLINTLEGPNYIVPAAGYYNDYINAQSIYNTWKPNVIGNLSASAGDDQILGGCYAIWHDSVDTRGNGISQYDSFDRFFSALPSYSARLWGEAEDRTYAEFSDLFAKTGTAPGTTIYGDLNYMTSSVVDYTFDEEVEKDSSVNRFHLQNQNNAEQAPTEDGKALKLKGGASFLETPEQLDLIGSDTTLSMRVKMDANAQGEQILCESKSEFGVYGTYALKASQKNTGKVGFSREGYDFSFDYTLPRGEWHVLEFRSGKDAVSLFVDGVLVDNNPDIYFANHPETELSEKLSRHGIRKIATMLVPLGRIGSNTNSFCGEIDYLTVTGAKEIAGDYGEKIPQEGWTAEACSTHPSEGSKEKAFDGDETTYWHQDYRTDTTLDGEHHWFEVTLPEATEIGRLSYLPRQGSLSGRIGEYSIEVTKEDGSKEMVVEHGRWAASFNRKYASFDPIVAKKVKLMVHRSEGNHATIAELNLYKPVPVEPIKTDLDTSLKEIAGMQKEDYSESSWNALQEAKEEAEKILEYSGSGADDYIYVYEMLQKAIENMTSLDELEKGRLDLSEAVKHAEYLLEQGDYTEASSEALRALIAGARDVMRKDNVTSEEMRDALQTIQNPESILITKASAKREELERAVSAAEADLREHAAGSTAASVEALTQAVNAAKSVLAKADASLDELTGALTNLQSKKLEKAAAPDNSEKPKEEQTLTDGAVAVVDAMQYTVLSAQEKTVKLTKGKNQKSVVIPNTINVNGIDCTVVAIGSSAFANCKKLASVSIGMHVVSIEAKAFYNCKKLKKVTLTGKTAPSVKKGAFQKTASKVTVKAGKIDKKKRAALLKKMKKPGGMSKKSIIK